MVGILRTSQRFQNDFVRTYFTLGLGVVLSFLLIVIHLQRIGLSFDDWIEGVAIELESRLALGRRFELQALVVISSSVVDF